MFDDICHAKAIQYTEYTIFHSVTTSDFYLDTQIKTFHLLFIKRLVY